MLFLLCSAAPRGQFSRTRLPRETESDVVLAPWQGPLMSTESSCSLSLSLSPSLPLSLVLSLSLSCSGALREFEQQRSASLGRCKSASAMCTFLCACISAARGDSPNSASDST